MIKYFAVSGMGLAKYWLEALILCYPVMYLTKKYECLILFLLININKKFDFFSKN
jgi:hypothetical protein